MYPPQTSLIPVTVALVRYIETHGFFGTFPYWYLGVPTNFLTGPIIPAILIGLHKSFPVFDYFQLSFFLIFLSFLIGGLGWGKLITILSGNKKTGLLIVVLYLILPWRWLSSLALSETSVVVAKNLLPWVLIYINYYLFSKNLKNMCWAISAIVVLLLINTSIIPTFIVGITALIISQNIKVTKQEEDDDESNELGKMFKQVLIITFAALCIVTIYYSPKFWITLLTNPSLGGAGGLEAIGNVFNFIKSFVPLIIAVLVVFFSGKFRNRANAFTIIWLGTFVLLTFFRYLANPAFWQDWTTWFFELEVGAIFLISNKKTIGMGLAIIIMSIVLSLFVYSKLGSPAFFSNSLPKGVTSLEEVNKVIQNSNQRVFLSGSTVFWANSLYDLSQIRGGRDEVSLNPDWLKASYEIRESSDIGKTKDWLLQLGVDFVLVHDNSSFEYYHDFQSVWKWENIGTKVWEGNGDLIYQIK